MNDLTIIPRTTKDDIARLRKIKTEWFRQKVLKIEEYKEIKTIEGKLRKRLEQEMEKK